MYEITTSDTETKPFEFYGDCYICAVGSGSFSIQRDTGLGFKTLTNESGEEMTFVGDGVLFNSVISCKKKLKHRFVGTTASTINVSLVKER